MKKSSKHPYKAGDRIRIIRPITNSGSVLHAGQTGVVIRAWSSYDTMYASGPRGVGWYTIVMIDGETCERDLRPCYFEKV